MTDVAVSDSGAAKDESAGRRLISVDALRGFDMFWLIGGIGLGRALGELHPTTFTQLLAAQLHHTDWQGLTFLDLIFPLFVFLVGVSLIFSLQRIIEKYGKKAAYWRVVKRSLILYLLGILYCGGLTHAWPSIKLLGVLQRIALCYLFASLIFCTFRLKRMIAICIVLLAGYWAVMTFVPVPGVGAGFFEKGKNLANYIDAQFLPGTKTNRSWDSEGLLSTFPAISGCLIGVFAGMLLKNKSIRERDKVVYLITGGVTAIGFGILWGCQFPVIKQLWTSSFILVSSGYSCIFMGAFYLIVDIWKVQRWARPLVWVGMNSLTIYLAINIVDVHKLTQRFAGGNIQNLFGHAGELMLQLVSLTLCVLFCRFLYQRKIFLRV